MLAAVSIPNLISGVSQQPITLRLATSCDEMINAWPSIVSGLNKRAPSEHIASLNIATSGNVVGYLIDRENTYRYIAVISDSDLKVFDLDGTEQTVTFPDGKYYLNATLNPVTAFRFVTLGDTTFILNREITVQPDDFGEAGGASYTPTGTVTNVSDLPTPATIGDVYFVTGTRTYYRYETIPAKSDIYNWQANGNRVTNFTPPAGSTIVTSLPLRPSAGQIVWLKTVSRETVKTQVGTDIRGAPVYETNVLDVVYYQRYKAILTQAATPSFDTWVRRRLADLTTISTVRLDPSGLATVYVTQSVANTNYNVYINGALKATYLSPTGVDAATSIPGTSTIAGQLASALNTSGYTVTQIGSTISIKNLSIGTTVTTTSSQGDQVLKCYTDSVKQFTELPPNEVNGRIVKVKGDVKENGDDYYVVFNNGIWTETYGYNESGGPDPQTMPHVLQRQADGTWVFKRWAWDARNAGDRTSNPDPSFFGSTLNDIFLYANRLGFVSDENVILSEADNFENFYRTSLAVLVDSDPLDLAVLSSGLDILRHGVQFDKDLLMMGDRNQFRLTYQQYLGPKNVQIQYATSFNVSPDVRPVNMGGSVYFVDDKILYNYLKVWEYFPKDNRVGDDAEDTTAPVPEYIPTGATFITGSPRLKTIVVNSQNSPDTLFLYKYFWTGNTKIQNAWFKWQFPDCTAIYWAGFSSQYLYVILQRSDGIMLERIRIDEVVSRNDISSRVTVDRQVDKANLVIAYNSTTKKSTITLPYTTTEDIEIVATNSTGVDETTISDFRLQTTKVAGNQVTVDGDITGWTSIKAGINYTFLYRFSKPFFKAPKGQSEVTILDVTRAQLRYMRVQYSDTAYFKTRLAYPGRTDVYTEFDGKIVGDAQNIIGRGVYDTGVYSVPLLGNSENVTFELINDAPFACSFGSAEWSGIYSPRATKRM